MAPAVIVDSYGSEWVLRPIVDLQDTKLYKSHRGVLFRGKQMEIISMEATGEVSGLIITQPPNQRDTVTDDALTSSMRRLQP